jgi:hypothetical protein
MYDGISLSLMIRNRFIIRLLECAVLVRLMFEIPIRLCFVHFDGVMKLTIDLNVFLEYELDGQRSNLLLETVFEIPHTFVSGLFI